VAINTTAAFAVEESSQVAAARRAALLLAGRVGFDETPAGQVALVASELATNLAKHALSGEILLRQLGGERAPDEGMGVEILAIDRGPGMPDEALSRRDGYSTAGTLGHGLGAVARQSHEFELHTHPSGTVAMARLWRDAPPPPSSRPLFDVGAVHVSKHGEDVCGDELGWRHRGDRLAVMVADGLGHGLAAHDAAHLAVKVFHDFGEEPPQRIVTDAHAALRASRGAAIAVVAVDIERGVARYCGLGNISGVILRPDGTRQSLVSQNGTAGHTASRIQEFHYPVTAGGTLILHSDGLSTHWDAQKYPGLLRRHPSIIAGLLYRDFSRRRDDVTVVVARSRSVA
jgi:anti-sigma regulatory factor (Ser/Thr protein kinase)